MSEFLAPGVYIEEVAFGAHPIEGVTTSTAGFIGAAGSVWPAPLAGRSLMRDKADLGCAGRPGESCGSASP